MSEPLQAALPRELYVDESAWLTERDAVLYGEWYCVGRRDDLGLAEPRRAATVEIAGESVLLTSDEQGELRAAYNVCRHRGCQLRPPGQPAGEASAIRCPYHSWTYGLDGRLLKSPHAEVEDPAEFALHPVGVETWGGFVFVHLTPERVDAAGRAGRRRPARRSPTTGWPTWSPAGCSTYDVAANYKVLLENYNECYHCGPVHPELSRLVPSFAGGGGGPGLGQGHPAPRGRLDVHDDRHDGPRAAARPRRGRADPAQGRPRLPQPHGLGVRRPRRGLRPPAARRWTGPGSPARCCSRADEAARPTFDPSDAADLWDLVNQQDWAICEAVQRGMSSRPTRTAGSRRWRTTASTSAVGCCPGWSAAVLMTS